MKQCAIVQNGKDIIKVSNLKRKYNKIINNNNMQILEECDIEELEDKFKYWYNNIINKSEEIKDKEIILYHFKNLKTGYTITSVYDDLYHLKKVCNDWVDYVRMDM